MNMRDKLDVLMLLSALESWGFTTSKSLETAFPEYLHEELSRVVCKLKTEILEGNNADDR